MATTLRPRPAALILTPNAEARIAALLILACALLPGCALPGYRDAGDALAAFERLQAARLAGETASACGWRTVFDHKVPCCSSGAPDLATRPSPRRAGPGPCPVA